MKQNQQSLLEQLIALYSLACVNGLYDAAVCVRQQIAKIKAADDFSEMYEEVMRATEDFVRQRSISKYDHNKVDDNISIDEEITNLRTRIDTLYDVYQALRPLDNNIANRVMEKADQLSHQLSHQLSKVLNVKGKIKYDNDQYIDSLEEEK